MSNGKLLLIDGHSMAYRAFFALPVDKFSTSTGQHTNAVFGFTSMLINLLRDEDPTHIGVAFDVARESFRTEEYPEYKATRAKSPDEFRGQVDLIKELLDALKIPRLEKPGFEADDLIATLATREAARGFDIYIVTGDRDAMQLVNEHVTVLYPRKGVSDLVRLDPEGVEEKYLVAPSRYPELAALVGETSDNLVGVPGVGPKTAAKWLREHDGLDNLLERAEQVKGKAGESLRANLDAVRRNRRLNALVCDVELPESVDDLTRGAIDLPKTEELFDALEFRALRPRLAEVISDPEEEVEGGGFVVEGAKLAPGEVPGWLEEHASAPVGLHMVGNWGAGTGDLVGLGIAAEDEQGAYLSPTDFTPEDDAAFAAWLKDPAREKVIHDAKGLVLAATERGWSIEGIRMDTLLAGYVLHPESRTPKLEALVLRYLGRELSTGQQPEADQLALDFGDDDASEDAMLRARAVLELSSVLRTELEESNQLTLLTDVEQPLTGVLARMERIGIAVDRDRLDELRADFDQAVSAAQQAAFDAIGHEVNLGSPKQLQAVLFDELEMPKTRKTKSGYTTDAEALAGLYEKTQHPFLEHLLAHRDRIKLRQTVDGLIAAIGDDGRIHTTYQQTIAATGRLSSTDPNLQNIPIRTALGRQIRTAFVAGPGYECLMSADYSQIEMRLMADASADEKLIEAFQSGRDFHNEMASKVFRAEPGEVTGEMRARIKAMNYGLAYGLSAYGLSNQLGIPVAEARELMDDYFGRVGGVRRYLADVVETARQLGYTETMLGRRRYLPDLTSSNRQRREMAERAALNAPIQGSAADVIKLAMLEVDDALAKSQLKSRVLLQVHDELVIEVAPGETEELSELVSTAMAGAADLAVPLSISVGLGDNWESAAH